MERMNARRRAHQKLATMNPGTSSATSIISPAFMTKVKSPSVKMVIGSVRIIRTGRMIAVISPNAIAVISAVKNPATTIPEKT